MLPEITNLALNDAMLVGPGAAHAECSVDQPVKEALHRAPLLSVFSIEQRHDVAIVVTHMSDDRGEQAPALDGGMGQQAASDEIGTQISMVATSTPGR